MNRIARGLVLCSLAIVFWVGNVFGETFHFEMLHRYSPKLRSRMESRNGKVDMNWPKERSWEYYNSLIHHDRVRHQSRNLQEVNGSYSLAPSNITAQLWGGLHYTQIEVGTPKVPFLVVLDTGSDLLWLPCQCKACAPTTGSDYGLTFNLSVYDPSSSQTSKNITCKDEMCETTLAQNTCISATQSCNYSVSYLQEDTSTAGILIQDVIYLTSENSGGNTTSTPVYFGCGEEQSGPFLSGQAAPNGLLGLGLDKISVPSTLSRNGLVSNSFSMCFADPKTPGRLTFGERGRSNLQSTPLLSLNIASTAYAVATTGVFIGDEALSLTDNFIFDTGSSFTLMPQASFQALGSVLNRQINLIQFPDSGIFDYCWNISTTSDLDLLVSWTLMFSGGSNMTLTSPYVAFVNEEGNVTYVCLGVLETTIDTGIIAHNFMYGYELFFDSDSGTLSWALTNCSYPNENLAPSLAPSPSGLSPEPSPSGLSPEPSPKPSVAPTTPVIPPPSEIPTPQSKGAQSSHYNVFLLLICTIMIKNFV